MKSTLWILAPKGSPIDQQVAAVNLTAGLVQNQQESVRGKIIELVASRLQRRQPNTTSEKPSEDIASGSSPQGK